MVHAAMHIGYRSANQLPVMISFHGSVRKLHVVSPIMIHSRKKDPAEICEFIERFRKEDPSTPIVLVPTSFNSVTEEEWKERGANIIIYANQLMRAAVPAIRRAAESILTHHRAQECDDELMPFKEIIRLIPEE